MEPTGRKLQNSYILRQPSLVASRLVEELIEDGEKGLMDDRNNQRFGRYEILSELGRGAMGVVYKARDPKINRTVAVKTISMAGQSPEEERDYRARFFREAEAAGRLSHPGIVTIFDVGEEAETRTPYIVMEFVGGESLEQMLLQNDRKLPVEIALQLARELAEALDCAHRQGVVHRDLKPANILMTEDGHAKIADFGVAKLNLANQTLAGRALGTPAYMSPEQLNGETVDGRSDLFSLGVILYTMLTGYRPFQGNSALTVSFKVVNREPIPATVLDAELPAGLDRIIERAMAKDPSERYSNGAEMVQDIQNLRTGRNPVSKTKLASPSAGGSVAKKAPVAVESSARDRTAPDLPALELPDPGPSAPSQPILGRPSVAAELLAVAHVLPLEQDAINRLRKMSVAGIALFAGLFLLGFWVVSFSPQRVHLRTAAPLHPVKALVPATPAPTRAGDQAVSAKTASTPAAHRVASAKTTPASAGARRHASAKVASPSPAQVAKESPESSKPQRTSTPPATVTRATLVSAAPALTPVVAAVVTPATLQIEVDHHFTQAHLSIWVDENLAYTCELEGTEKKRLGVFHHVQGHELHVAQVTAGKHRLRVRVTSGSDTPTSTGSATTAASEAVTAPPAGLPTYDQSAFVDGDFTSAKDTVLSITFNKHGEINLHLQ
ncbi:MAG: protein kinase [Terriglobales bacterium]